jgi:hypothetical protein
LHKQECRPAGEHSEQSVGALALLHRTSLFDGVPAKPVRPLTPKAAPTYPSRVTIKKFPLEPRSKAAPSISNQ